MQVHSIIAGPEELAGLEAAFDRAWSEITARSLFIGGGEASRKEWLAHIVLGLFQADSDVDLADKAVEQFLATAPSSHLYRDFA